MPSRFPRVRTVAALAGVWVAGTGAATATAWFAVGLVTGGGESDPRSAGSTQAVREVVATSARPWARPTAGAAGVRSSTGPARHETPPPGGLPAATAGPSTPAGSSEHPSLAPATSAPPSAGPSIGPSTPLRSPVPPAGPTTGQAPLGGTATWQVRGGQLSARCPAATAVRLVYATPSDGWSVEVASTGPSVVELTFRRSEAETHVRVRCESGTPRLSTEGSDGHDKHRSGGD